MGEEEFTRQWFMVFAHCSSSDDDVIYPIIDYNVTMTLSEYVTSTQQTCDSQRESPPKGIMFGVICVVVLVLVSGGGAMWRCDVYQRRKISDKSVGQSLIQSEQQHSSDEDGNDNINAEQKSDDEEERSELIENGNEKDDVELQCA